jgi:hypothetical protein
MIQVQGIGGLRGVLALLQAKLSDWRKFWPRVEAHMPSQQMRWWDARWNRSGISHSPHTIKARSRGLRVPVRESRRRRTLSDKLKRPSYYTANRPGTRARPSSPYFEWTGSLRRATERFTAREAARAAINTDDNYRGPLNQGTAAAILSGVEFNPWDTKALDSVIESEMESFLREDVLGGIL